MTAELDQLRKLQQAGEYKAVIAATESTRPDQTEALLLRGLAQLLGEDQQTGAKNLQALLNQQTPPNNTAHASDTGLAQMLTGQLTIAAETLQNTLKHPDVSALEFGRLAAVRFALGECTEAERLYLEAINREPGREHWHHNLASLYLMEQKLDQALEHYSRALDIVPDFERSVSAKRRLLVAMDKSDELVADLEARLNESPEDTGLTIQLARALQIDGRFTDGLRCLLKRLVPVKDLLAGAETEDSDAKRDEQIQLRLALTELHAKRSLYLPALVRYREIETLNPEHPQILQFRLAQVQLLIELGRMQDATDLLNSLLSEHPDSNPVKMVHCQLLNETGRYQEAEQTLRELAQIYPGDTAIKTSLAQTLLWIGNLEESGRLFEEAAQLNPMALAQLTRTGHFPDDENALATLEKLADNRFLPRESRAPMAFAVAEIHDKRGQYERAANYLVKANSLINRDIDYNPDRFSKRIDDVIRVFDKAYFEKLSTIRNADRTPILVVGMPRSGTTLTEQILSAHPEVFGAGELDLLPNLNRLMPKVLGSKLSTPDCMAAMTPSYREEAARYYLHGLLQHDSDHHYIVDKLPHNFVNLGLAVSILVNVKIIHVKRDPLDTALSNFQQNFKARDGGMGYAFDLENIARQIIDYQRVMGHWAKVLPGRIYELQYETLVSDPEQATRALLNFVGLDWHDNIKNFHNQDRAVRTASVAQVRKPLYKSSSGKWKNYADLMQPVLERLKGNPEQ